jgi:hypothetical protein
MNPIDLAWLAGYLEGEGCFHIRSVQRRSPSMHAATTDKDIAEKVARLFGVSVSTLVRPTVTGKTVYNVRLGGDRSIEMMQALRPYMGLRRSARIDEVLRLALSRPGYASGERQGVAKLSEAAVREIRRDVRDGKRGTMASLAKKFGVSHACVWFVCRGTTWKHVA